MNDLILLPKTELMSARVCNLFSSFLQNCPSAGRALGSQPRGGPATHGPIAQGMSARPPRGAGEKRQRAGPSLISAGGEAGAGVVRSGHIGPAQIPGGGQTGLGGREAQAGVAQVWTAGPWVSGREGQGRDAGLGGSWPPPGSYGPALAPSASPRRAQSRPSAGLPAENELFDTSVCRPQAYPQHTW